MKKPSLRMISRVLTLLAIFVLLITSCTPGNTAVTSSGSLRAWIDQPADGGFTLPLAPYTIVAHARQDGGGVTAINFMVNDTLLGSVPTNTGEELTQASLEWNPSAPGEYRIQAIAINSAGQQALSEVSLVCISNDPNGDCSAAESGKPSAVVDTEIRVGGAPNPASIGASCNPADRIINFEAYVPDTGGAIEVDIHGYLVGTSGERAEFVLALSPGTTVGSYVGTLDLGTLYNGVLGGVDGTLEFELALLNEAKEWFKTSKQQTISVRYCGATTPLEGLVKVGGVPNPVFFGKCEPVDPTAIDFEAITDIDPGMFDHMDLGYAWFDNEGNWLGTIGEEIRAEMTLSSSGWYTYHLDVNSVIPAGFPAAGQIKFRAIVVNTDNADVAFSEVETFTVKDCEAVPQPQTTITPTIYQPPQQGVTVTVPPPATCDDYNNKPGKCKNLGCYYWSDGTCSENPEPAPPSCSDYTKDPSGCKNAGCNYWSDGTCSEDPEPAPPPSCSDYFKDPDGCKNAGCYYWTDGTCSEKPE